MAVLANSHAQAACWTLRCRSVSFWWSRPQGGTQRSPWWSLQLDARGGLVTAQGLALQGSSGEPRVPATATQVRIDSAGKVRADDNPAGNLRVVRLNSGDSLVTLGEGLYAVPQGGASSLQAVTNPALHVGHLEASNVSSAQEMVALMNTTRHAESMVRLIQGSDELMEKTIRKLGEM